MLRLVGGLFLLWLAWKSFSAKPADPRSIGNAEGKARLHVVKAWGSTMLLTLANPATILSSIAIFAGLGVGAGLTRDAHGYGLAALLVLGVFLGSALWWLMLSGVTGYFREKMQARHLVWVNRGSGVIIATFGIVAMGSLFFV